MKKLIAVLASTAALTAAPTAAFAVNKHGGTTSQMGCTLAGTTLGAALDLSGSGYTPGAPYGVIFNWPDGSAAGIGTYANSSGGLSVSETAYYSGTTVADVTSSGKVVASCSATVS